MILSWQRDLLITGAWMHYAHKTKVQQTVVKPNHEIYYLRLK